MGSPERLRSTLEAELGEPITVDALTADWQIAQRAAGHRHSSDDVLTAWYALGEAGPARRVVVRTRSSQHADRVLDLGAGIGGVGLLVLWGLGPDARLTCVEAQAISHRLLIANVEHNGLGERVDTRLGDLRELALAERFPLVTGSPPYFPPGTGIVPADPQKAHARFELRGDVADYARCAERHLEDGGVFVFCFPAVQRDRALAAVRGAGLVTTSYREVVPRAGRPPLFTLFACRRTGGQPTIEPPLEVRRADGSLTDEMQEVRRRFGFGA